MSWTCFSTAIGLALTRIAVKAGALAADTSSALETAWHASKALNHFACAGQSRGLQ